MLKVLMYGFHPMYKELVGVNLGDFANDYRGVEKRPVPRHQKRDLGVDQRAQEGLAQPSEARNYHK